MYRGYLKFFFFYKKGKLKTAHLGGTGAAVLIVKKNIIKC